MAVLSILLTAPVGAAAIALTGPHLMRRVEPEDQQQEMATRDCLLSTLNEADTGVVSSHT